MTYITKVKAAALGTAAVYADDYAFALCNAAIHCYLEQCKQDTPVAHELAAMRAKVDQSVTPEYMEWLQSLYPARNGVGGNEAWNAGAEWGVKNYLSTVADELPTPALQIPHDLGYIGYYSRNQMLTAQVVQDAKLSAERDAERAADRAAMQLALDVIQKGHTYAVRDSAVNALEARLWDAHRVTLSVDC